MNINSLPPWIGKAFWYYAIAGGWQGDKVSKQPLTADYLGSCKVLETTTGEILDFTAAEHAVTRGDGLLCGCPQATNMITNGFDPSLWTPVTSTITATGQSIGDLIEYAITATAGNQYDRRNFFNSSVHGNPSGAITGSTLYNLGTSGGLRIVFFDQTATLISAIAYDGSSWSTVENAGTVSYVVKEESCGVVRINYKIDWITPANSISIGIGPNTNTIGETLKVYAAPYVLDSTPHIWPFVLDGAVTMQARSGGAKMDLTTMSKALDAWNGNASRNPVLSTGNLDAGKRYEIVTTETDYFGVGVVAGDRVTGLITALDANNTVQEISNATSTTTIRFKVGTAAADMPNPGNIYILWTDLAGGNALLYLRRIDISVFVVVLYDGVTFLTLNLNWQANTVYEAQMRIGDSSGTHKMQVSVRDITNNGAWLHSVLSNSIGYFQVSSAMEAALAYNSDHVVSIDDRIIVDPRCTFQTPT